MFKMIPTMEAKTEKLVGESFKIGNRTFYPVMDVFTLSVDGKSFFTVCISPLAMVVVEKKQKYAISLTEETITLTELIEKVPSLKEKVK